ncbi:hypothetical protein DL546_000711 [Coniochaeta pulveracea]|uniref:Uncharacterized protein n=1 Tax=Coniochaeta pulveracea TaxID=177199 RepID=A0A420XW50_9PEZI|nr:hypothetical protein DL546_000711 [Coniochaeta pulveracea]
MAPIEEMTDHQLFVSMVENQQLIIEQQRELTERLRPANAGHWGNATIAALAAISVFLALVSVALSFRRPTSRQAPDVQPWVRHPSATVGDFVSGPGTPAMGTVAGVVDLESGLRPRARSGRSVISRRSHPSTGSDVPVPEE